MVLKPEPERRGFKQPPRGLADVSVSEIMFDRSYCNKSFYHSLAKFGKTLPKVHFCISITAHKSMKDS